MSRPAASASAAPPRPRSTAVCRNWLQGRCTRSNCRYLHAPPDAPSTPAASSGAPQDRLAAIRRSSPPPSAAVSYDVSPASASPRGGSPAPASPPARPVFEPAPEPAPTHLTTPSAPAPAPAPAPLAAPAVLPGVWHFVAPGAAACGARAYALSISAAGRFELWERADSAAGAELRGMAGHVAVDAAAPDALSLRLTKTAECLVPPGAAPLAAECAPQTAPATVVAAGARHVALELAAFGATLVFWRAC